MAPKPTSSSLSLSITNPLVLYRALLATKRIRADPAQHRLALQLQQLYYRLKDYDPEIEYRWRLEQVARLTRRQQRRRSPIEAEAEGQVRRKAVFDDNADDGPVPSFTLSKLFGRDGSAGIAKSMMALTRTVPAHDSAMDIDSPQGLLLYGEVGRGKSMLLDLLYSSLPTKKKRRWHFNTFILDVFRRLEMARIERTAASETGLDHEHVVLSLARETMDTSPILFLDEFQMPDRVSGKLVHGFLTSFFSLGGVLVASSNRMPEELAKASGVEFARMAGDSGTFKWGRGGKYWEKLGLSQGQQAARSDFGLFVDILKKRCEIWEMEGEKDWRREDGEIGLAAVEKQEKEIEQMVEDALTPSGQISGSGKSSLTNEEDSSASSDSPRHYHISVPLDSEQSSSPSLESDLRRLNPSQTWKPSTLTVYARKIVLPQTNMESRTAVLPFNLLCASYLGPADYISICSTFHTLVVTSVPVLTLLQKNEARRFITLLDACYEARCRLMVEAAAPPDRLFFPETRTRRGPGGSMLEQGDSIESEAFSEMYQDSTAPFRPNISSYISGDESAIPTPSLYNPSARSVLADEDADFGPTYGNGRNHGMSSDAALDERDLPRGPQGMEELERRQGPDFTQTGAFTGQDEQFAYKRARSRLWEMCGRKWWEERDGKDAEDWWTPVGTEGRFWEKHKDVMKQIMVDAMADRDIVRDSGQVGSIRNDDNAPNPTNPKDEGLFRHGASPFRTVAEPPPKFGWQHAWGMMQWGKKAGEWGKGVDGDRSRTDVEGNDRNDRKEKRQR